MEIIERLKQQVLRGELLTRGDILELSETKDREKLYRAAGEITRHFGKPSFNPCSIINARAGKCSENCKWCAQSGHYHTGSDVHGIVPACYVMKQARHDEKKGVKRFCQVTSGRSVKGDALKRICENYRELRKNTRLFLCGSLGLLEKEELQQLWDAGVRRYHCNLETAPSYFAQVCTSHTIEDKIQTLKWAREIGFELCCGGIIGMGETREQRIELGLALRELQPDSIPINILSPVKGTPLYDTVPIDDGEILLTIAVFRFLHPKAELRFAGGRGRLSHEVQLKALEIGINAAVVGDLLTTVGSDIDGDRALTAEAGYLPWP
ncbi:biotin synthase BioB [uncultured Bacteroides sp.]|uniref:biotin synthase BioB n=1 Tax=uncultured Bacteroides sp. TaxID=162156 RepID=UPI0025D28EE0|nr:biotin synthase BioB [uncultured Bacteroides sp.]